MDFTLCMADVWSHLTASGAKAVPRSVVSGFLAAIFIWLSCSTGEAVAQSRADDSARGPFHGAYGLSGRQSLFSISSGHLTVPGGSITVYPFDPYGGGVLLYTDYPPWGECMLERRPVSTIHFLGWRTFLICPN